jgi:hypothetical protein
MRRKHVFLFLVATLGQLGWVPRAVAAWDIGILVSAGDVGQYCSARVDSAGDIHVVYLRADTDEIYALSQSAGMWQPPALVSAAGTTAGGPCGLWASGAGVLRCTWRWSGSWTLMYAGSEEIHEWELGDVAVGADNIGANLSVEQTAAGELAVACRNATDESLVLIERDAYGVWSPPVVVDAGPGRGFYPDVTWRPGVGFVFSERDQNETALLYADSALSASDWEIGPVTSSTDNTGTHLSLYRRDTGELSVACRNETRGTLMFTTRDTLGVWSALDTIDAGSSRGFYCDHTWRPGSGYAFSERDNATASLLYVDHVLRSHDWKIGTVRTFGDAGRYVSATRMPDGHVACSFYRYDGGTKGSVEIAYNVGSEDYWVVRTVADSIATSAGSLVTSDLTITSGWEGYVSFQHDISSHLYYAWNDSVTTAVADDPPPGSAPLAFQLCPNFPNPFNPRTTISYSIPQTGVVHLAIYDVSGKRVRVLVDGLEPAGHHRLTWDGTSDRGQATASGVYFLRLSANGRQLAQKLVLVR